MVIDDQVKDEKLQYDINIETAKISAFHQAKLTSMNILQVKKYCLLTKKNDK